MRKKNSPPLTKGEKPSVVVFSGGIGGAKLAWGMYEELGGVSGAENLSLVANTADDEFFYGLRVCPDMDTLLYTLSGKQHSRQGWGRRKETFHALKEVSLLGGESWFQLGDKDLGLHLFRSAALVRGLSLTEVSKQVAKAFGLGCKLFPMSDSLVQTKLLTEKGVLGLQEYLVRERGELAVKEISYAGLATALPSQEVKEALLSARLIVLAPSNPYLSLLPILKLPKMAQLLRKSPAKIWAISPLIKGEALKGPTAKLMQGFGLSPNPLEVARLYAGMVDGMVVHPSDKAWEKPLQEAGFGVKVWPILLNTSARKKALAKRLLSLLKEG